MDGGAVSIRIEWTKRRKGVRRLRFIVLGAPPKPGDFRPTLGAGDVNPKTGKAELEHGCLSLEQLEQIETLAEPLL